MGHLQFYLNGRVVEVANATPTTTLLNWLRHERRLTGTKKVRGRGLWCLHRGHLDRQAVGGPQWRAVNSCLVLLPSCMVARS